MIRISTFSQVMILLLINLFHIVIFLTNKNWTVNYFVTYLKYVNNQNIRNDNSSIIYPDTEAHSTHYTNLFCDTSVKNRNNKFNI